jgi:hypothetical protein
MNNLFDLPELSKSEKLKKSRKVTTDLTRQVIDWLNNTMQFKVHRSNNFPSPRISRTKEQFKYQDSNGDEQVFEYDKVEIFFKKNNIKEKILDISGFRIGDGKHIEIEVKTGKDELSEGQVNRIKEITAAGGISFVFDSMETFLMQIKPYVETKYAF